MVWMTCSSIVWLMWRLKNFMWHASLQKKMETFANCCKTLLFFKNFFILEWCWSLHFSMFLWACQSMNCFTYFKNYKFLYIFFDDHCSAVHPSISLSVTLLLCALIVLNKTTISLPTETSSSEMRVCKKNYCYWSAYTGSSHYVIKYCQQWDKSREWNFFVLNRDCKDM